MQSVSGLDQGQMVKDTVNMIITNIFSTLFNSGVGLANNSSTFEQSTLQTPLTLQTRKFY